MDGEMAPFVICLPHKHGCLSWSPRTDIKMGVGEWEERKKLGIAAA